MSTDIAPASTGTLRPRPTTRSSIRQSLNLSSVGRALADVMHKDGKDAAQEREKPPRKTKDLSSRRSSSLAPPAPRVSTDRMLPPKITEASPDPKTKTITRASRRMSTLTSKKPPLTDSDETSSAPPAPSPKPIVPRPSTLRPRTSNTSALPKYRPKSTLVEPEPPKKPPSPAVRAGTRRRLSSSDDHKEDRPKGTLEAPPSEEKKGRPISPLPHRAALKVNLTSAINVKPSRPETPDKKSKLPLADSPSSRHGSSARPTKTSKMSTGATSIRSAIPRPPSSASTSSSSRVPQTPKTPTSAMKVTPASSQKSGKESPSSIRKLAPSAPESPLGRLSARRMPKSSPISPQRPRLEFTTTTPTGSATLFTEGSSMDSMEANDVEFMLSSAISPSAPTPALPRFRTTGHSASQQPQTPTRPSLFLPGRNNLSYLSPEPPNSQSSPFLRPRAHHPGNDRGSILSWEQLAKQNKTLGDEDVERMLSEIDAPFRSGAVSPALTATLDVPESPSLSALPSPTGYGSISQVLLPDVTPSPAVHNISQRFNHGRSDATFGDAASATMLRLQLAAAESKAREHQAQTEALQRQLQAAKDARLRDADELARQISALEEQVHGNLAVDTQRLEAIGALEGQLREAHAARSHAVHNALMQMHERVTAEHLAGLDAQMRRVELAARAHEARSAWDVVANTADAELGFIEANREMLAVLLMGLDQTQAQLRVLSA